MKYIVTINNNNYEVEVERGEARIVKTEEAPKVTAAQAAEASAPAASMSAPAPAPKPVQAAQGDKLLAPMPGIILQIKKNAGDQVKKGEVILVLEAMKMENEIFSPRDGVIAQILTSPSASVSTGDVLAVIK